MTDTDERYMREALREARAAGAEDEVPIGAVVVCRGRVIARGHNMTERLHDPTAHAEVKAIRAACARLGNYRLDGCVLAVTLEPCTMCAGAILHARLAGIVYGCEDRLAGAVASRADVLDQGLAGRLAWHMGGVLARDCAGLLEAFFAARRG